MTPVSGRSPEPRYGPSVIASRNAWMLGRADVARERMAQMMAAVNADNPHDLAFSGLLRRRTSALPERIRASRGSGGAGARAVREKSISA